MKALMIAAVAFALVGGLADAAPKRHVTHHAPPKPTFPLTLVERLLAHAQLVAADKDIDQFTEEGPPNPADVGQPFKLELPTSGTGSTANMVYEEGKLTFYIQLKDFHDEGITTPVSQWRNHQIIGIGGSIKEHGSYVGSNAFGATRTVDRASIYNRAILAVTYPPPGHFSPEITSIWDTYRVDLDLSGDAARAVAKNTRLIIEGKTALADGKLFGCHDMYLSPTIDAPIDGMHRTCWVGADISRIAFVNMATGEILKEWKLDTAKAPEPVSFTADQISEYYPVRAERAGIAGSATLSCRFDGENRLQDCQLVSEDPDSYGFGAAALSMVRLYRGSGHRGEPVTFTVNFR